VAILRPNPLRWIGYAYGMRLSDRYREWVLYDATTRTWLLRYVARILVKTLPWLVAGFFVLVWLTPLPVGQAVLAMGFALVLSLYFTLTSADELTETRLVKHGYPANTGKRIRKQRTGSTWGRWRPSA
jgi:Family of unknown function (DUF5313)